MLFFQHNRHAGMLSEYVYKYFQLISSANLLTIWCLLTPYFSKRRALTRLMSRPQLFHPMDSAVVTALSSVLFANDSQR